MKPLTPNAMIQNRYLIVQLIGKGGMGEVYLAVDQRLGSAVALKRTFFSENEELGSAFEREARILARLRHPVLPKVIDHFSENGDQFLVMEHISGDDLAKRIETTNKPFPLSWVMFWADQMLDALNYLHSHEPPIVHRDIKPQNLKLTDDNHIVLLDFGLSKDFDSNTGGQGLNSASVAGYSPHFASMEQIRGTGTDARSDIYSLSATLYQLLTNTIPVDVLTRADALLSGAKDPIVPITDINAEVSTAISAAILKGIGVRQNERFTTAVEMQKTLRRAFNRGDADSAAEPAPLSGMGANVAAPAPGAEVTAILPKTPSDTAGISVNNTAVTDSRAPTEQFDQADIKTEVLRTDTAGNFEEVAPPPSQPTPAEEMPPLPVVPETPPPAETREVSALPAADLTTKPPVAETREVSALPAADLTTKPPVAETREMAAAASAGAAAAQAPVNTAQPKKRSSKMGLVIGLLAGLFLLTALAGAGGWYLYTNSVAAVPQPSPSPTPVVAAIPSPAATIMAEAEPEGNSNSVTQQVSDDNSADENADKTVGTTTPTGSKPAPPTATKTNPAKPAQPPPAKAAPKTKPRDDRTVILQ